MRSKHATRYTGKESEDITAKILRLYDEGASWPKIAKSVGLSLPAVKSRLLTYLLEERNARQN